MSPDLQTSGKHSIRKDNWFELPGACGKLFLKARRCFFGLLFFYPSLQDAEIEILERIVLENLLLEIISYLMIKRWDGKSDGGFLFLLEGLRLEQ